MKGLMIELNDVEWKVTRVYSKTYQIESTKDSKRDTIPKDEVEFVSGRGYLKADLTQTPHKIESSVVDSVEKSTILPGNEEEKNRRGRPHDPNSKLEQCYQIYLTEHEKGRAHTMKVFSEKLSISGNCGNTYFYRCKSRAVQEGLERSGEKGKVSSK